MDLASVETDLSNGRAVRSHTQIVFAALTLFLIAGAIAAVSPSLTAPVGMLRSSLEYRPTGSNSMRFAGLLAPNAVPLEQISSGLVLAVLLSEDRNFAQHRGVDWTEAAWALKGFVLEGRPLRGASTIEQQLARTVFLTNQRSLLRKFSELILAFRISYEFTKPEILSLYLNTVHWGPEIYGIREAAKHYYGAEAKTLSIEASVLLATVLPDPEGRALQGGFADLVGGYRRALARRMFTTYAVLHRLGWDLPGASISTEAVLSAPLGEAVDRIRTAAQPSAVAQAAAKEAMRRLKNQIRTGQP